MAKLNERWRYTPVVDKRPFLDGWQNKPLRYEDALNDPHGNGIGIILGRHSGGIMALDFDGTEAFDYFHKLFGPIGNYDTDMAWQSGKPDRMQIAWQVPVVYWNELHTIKVGPGKKLEFRWTGCQSVIPPSVHPETGSYDWVVEPDEEISTIPRKILDYWLEQCSEPVVISNFQPIINEPLEIKEKRVVKLLEIIQQNNPRPGYDDWLKWSFAVAKELGASDAINVMQQFFPEEHRGEYKKLFSNSYKMNASPGIGSLCYEAKKYDECKFLGEFYQQSLPGGLNEKIALQNAMRLLRRTK